ncbi:MULTISPECIES: Tfp pilus assembly protein FimT/FimU [unclassified Synechocystis]|uniref:pilus assembly FimT family protein n=1 Tax=unclassified Synechocystis TaxID=2640012 RepID=UPI000491B7EB|nr:MULTISPECIES: prepilin-type N-terminal cleavage/methylation domain-containing protein [unclassified Synechocystis]MCT0252388.1 prepilin-type N-terminal cleavage/methylation domain-containing protein [Synechocystis sp. CS-94]
MKLSTVYKLFLPVSGPKFTKHNNRGVSLVELIVGVIIGGILIQLAYFAFSVNREMYLKDAAKNNSNQNLKTVFEVVGPTITQAGEGIGTDPNFPVISIRPFPNGSTNSEIIIRQLKIATRLRVCEDITAGTQTEITVLSADVTAPAGCAPVDGNGDNYPDDLAQWKSYRESNGGNLRVYIYNGNGQGEFLNYASEAIYDTGGSAIAGTPSLGQVASAAIGVTGNLTNNYTAGGSTQLLVLEERGYRLNETTLQATIDGVSINVIDNVGQFTVTATVRQNNANSVCTTLLPQTNTFTCTPSLATTYNWSQINGINVTSRPNVGDNAPGLSANNITQINSKSQTQTFYPRNLINF